MTSAYEREISNPSSRENWVMTSAYERANVRTDSGGAGGASRDIPHGHPYGKHRNAIFPRRFFVHKSQKNTHFYLSCQQTIGVVDLTFQGRV